MRQYSQWTKWIIYAVVIIIGASAVSVKTPFVVNPEYRIYTMYIFFTIYVLSALFLIYFISQPNICSAIKNNTREDIEQKNIRKICSVILGFFIIPAVPAIYFIALVFIMPIPLFKFLPVAENYLSAACIGQGYSYGYKGTGGGSYSVFKTSLYETFRVPGYSLNCSSTAQKTCSLYYKDVIYGKYVTKIRCNDL